MDVDAILLARIQFAFTVMFHIIFPSFTIGLAAFIATLLVRWRMTGEDKFHRMARYWTKIFAVSFAMGVVVVALGHLSANRFAPLLMTGILGGFTTFSAFSLDAMTIWERGQQGLAMGYVAASVILSLVAIAGGIWMTRSIVA